MCHKCQWEEYKALAEMLAEDGCIFAQDIVREWFSIAQHVTIAQRNALDKLADKFGYDPIGDIED